MGYVDQLMPGRRSLATRWQWWVLTFVLVVPNAALLFSSIQWIRDSPFSVDWWMMAEANRRIATGGMYEWGMRSPLNDVYLYTYSPLLAYLIAPALHFGIAFWRVLHFVALAGLPRVVALAALISGPFWFDVAAGNFLTFALVLAWRAVDGKRWAMVGYFGLTLLIPRPLMAPVALWLLWKRPESRMLAAATFAAGVSLTGATGELVPWLNALAQGTSQVGAPFDWGPSRLVGVWWWPAGLLIAALLLRKGRLGLASVAANPYTLPYNFLMLFLEVRPAIYRMRSDAPAPRKSHTAADLL